MVTFPMAFSDPRLKVTVFFEGTGNSLNASHGLSAIAEFLVIKSIRLSEDTNNPVYKLITDKLQLVLITC